MVISQKQFQGLVRKALKHKYPMYHCAFVYAKRGNKVIGLLILGRAVSNLGRQTLLKKLKLYANLTVTQNFKKWFQQQFNIR